MTDLVLFVRPGCDACREAESALREAGIAFVRATVGRVRPGLLRVIDEDGREGFEREEMIPATPALLVRHTDPPYVFATLEQILAYVAGRRGNPTPSV